MSADPSATCSYCPKLCRHACPVAEVERTEQATPTFKQQVAWLDAIGARPLDRERAEVLYLCAACRGTEAACRHRIDVGASLRDARARAVARGLAPAAVAAVADRFAARGGPFDLDLRARLDAALAGQPRAHGGALGVLPACAALAATPAGARPLDALGAVAALLRAGVAAAPALSDPPCCGYPLDALGHADAFRAHARRVAASLEGFDRVAPEGPACAWTLGVRYREVGVALRPAVVPLDRALEAHADALGPGPGEPAAPAGATYALHDACYLGRHLGRFDGPRRLVAALTGAPPRELRPNRHDALCAGGGGGLPATRPETARGCARRVADAFRESGADVLVTGCPSAARLVAGALGPEDGGRRVLTLAGLAASPPSRPPA